MNPLKNNSSTIPALNPKYIATNSRSTGPSGITLSYSKKALEDGLTLDHIEIRPLSYIGNQRADSGNDVVVLLEENEYDRYMGDEKRLIFKRNGNSTVFITGLVAAGRAVLYNDMRRLREVLSYLAMNEGLHLPEPGELERILEEDRGKFAKTLLIYLPDIALKAEEIREFNENIIHLMKFV